MRQFKRVLGNSSIYILGDILGKGTIFLLAPLYTRYFSPDEFAILTFSTVIYSVLYIFISFGLTGAAFRFYFVYSEEVERKQFYGTIWIFLIIASGLLALALVSAGKISLHIFAQIPFYPYVALTIGITYFRVSFELLPYQIIRASERSRLYLRFSIISLLVTLVFQYIYVVCLRQGVVGALRGNLATAICMAFIYALFIIKNCVFCFSIKKLEAALKYSIPLIPHFFANWGLNLSDRVILERNVSLGSMGIYSFGDLFRQGYFLIISGINSALMPMYGQAAKDRKIFQDISQLVTYYILVITITGLGIITFAPDIIKVITPPTYHSAINVVPWLIFAVFMQALYFVPMNLITQTAGVTRGVSWATLIAGGTNVVLNLLLTERYGIMAAAINTAAGYFLLFLLIFFVSKRICPINYQYIRLTKIILSASIVFSCEQLIDIDNFLAGIIVKILVLTLFPILLALSRFFTDDEKMKLVSIFQKDD